ncbi:amino acid ABC transporter permease [Labrys neptuniae]
MNGELLQKIVSALASGTVVTLSVTFGALALAILLGLMLATMRHLSSSRSIEFLIAAYTELFRNVPSLTYLFLIYFGLAYLGVKLSSFTAAVLGLGLIGGAVLADVFRSGLQAVASGQREAALSLGLSPWRCFRLIVLPQAMRVSLPPLGNYAIGLVKDTSLVAAIAAPEIMFNARQIVNQTFETATVYGAAALLYLLITIGIGRLLGHFEKRMAY